MRGAGLQRTADWVNTCDLCSDVEHRAGHAEGVRLFVAAGEVINRGPSRVPAGCPGGVHAAKTFQEAIRCVRLEPTGDTGAGKVRRRRRTEVRIETVSASGGEPTLRGLESLHHLFTVGFMNLRCVHLRERGACGITVCSAVIIC